MKHLPTVLVLLILGCRAPIPGWLSVPAPTTQDGVEVVIDGTVRSTTWLSGVTGTATNLSDVPLTRCKISFEAYSMHGALLGTASAEREGLDGGEAWNFEASFPSRIGDASTLSAPKVVVEP